MVLAQAIWREYPVLGLAVSAILVYVGLGLLRRTKTNSQKLPPGPRALPIVGHLHLMGDKPHVSLAKLAREHGPLMSLQLGSQLVVVASSPTMAKYVLQTYDYLLASRPRTAATRHTLFNNSDIAFAPYGPYWKLMRRITVADIFQPKRLEFFKPIRDQEVHDLLHWVVQSGVDCTPVCLRTRLQETTNNVISRIAVGKKYAELSSSKDPSLDMVEIINEIMFLLGAVNLSDYFPKLAFLDLQGYEKRMKDVKRRVKVSVGEIIAKRRDETKASGRTDTKDLLDVLLSLEPGKMEADVQITDENLTAVILDMYLGGTDTSAITTEWALAELVANPKALERVQAELDAVVGRDRLVQEDDVDRLPYLQAVVKETFRLHPAAPLLLPRICSEDCPVENYVIPKGAWVYVNVYAIGRDPNTWQHPLAFEPERFLESEVDEKGHYFELVPFGAGRRKCVGWELGLLNVRLLLSRLLQGFNLELPPSSDGRVDMTEQFGLTVMMANSLKVIAKPRLPQHLYK